MRVLLVEDDKLTRRVLERALVLRGHEVEAFGTAEEAWDAHLAEPFPLCILDWFLPGLDGLSLCRRIRSAPGGDAPVVVVITGQDRPEDLVEILNAGASDYLAKPISPAYFGVRVAIAERRVEDIQKRKRAEAALLSAQKLESLGVLAGGVAHDFNNLLVGILGNAGLLLMDLPDDEPARHAVEQIEEAGERAADLCKQMLAYSGRGHFVVQRLSLADVTADMRSALEMTVPGRVRLDLDLRAGPTVDADASQVRQAVMNLAQNAADALESGGGHVRVRTGHVLVTAERLEGAAFAADDAGPGLYAFVEVDDDGAGMDPETKARIFDPFFTTKFTGRGLGLPAVLGIARGHKGAIEVWSRVGRGTRVRLLLPAARIADAPLEADAESALYRGAGTVLVIDDEEAVRSVAGRMLERMGFEVVEQPDGLEGVRAFEASPDRFDAVLLDVTMPQLGGEEVLVRLRSLRPSLPVILMSGYSLVDLQDRLPGDVETAFLEKPFSQETLARAMRACG